MPYPGQVPGIGDNGPYGQPGGTWGADTGFFGGMLDPTQGGTLTVELPPGTYPTPGGGTVTQPPDYPFHPSEPYPYSEPVEPTVGAPVHGDDPTAGGDWPTEPYYPPAPPPSSPPPSSSSRAPASSSPVVQEGEYAQVERQPGASGWSILERIAGGVLGKLVSRVAGGPWGMVAEEIFVPTQISPEPDVRGQPGMSFPSSPRAPSPVMTNTTGSQTVTPGRAPRPERPSLPPIPRAPTVSVPKPDLGAPPWPVSPLSTSASTPPVATSVPSPSPVPPGPAASPSSSAGRTTPTGSTASTPSLTPLGSIGPWFRILPSLSPFGSRSPRKSAQPSLSSNQLSPSLSTPPAFAPPSSQSMTQPAPAIVGRAVSAPSIATGSGAPPLTPANPAALESLPAGDSCETPRQQKARRQRNREDCKRFITITIPKHRRRVCAAEAGHHIGKELGKELARTIGEKLGLRKPRRESKAKAKLRISKRGSISYGGVGVSIPKEMRPRPPGSIGRP